MKDIKNETITVDEANARLGGKKFDDAFWEFLVRRLNYKECRFDRKTRTIHLPSFVPFEELFSEILKEMEERQNDFRPCAACGVYHDTGADAGIFSDPRRLEGFICETCAREMSAWDFFNDHLAKD